MIKIYDGRSEFYQWDLDRQIILSDLNVDEVHFCNKTGDCSLVVEVYEKDGFRLANVPNVLLQTSWPIRVYAYCGECYTKESITLKVLARSKPDDYVYTETEVKRWDTLAQKAEETLNECKELEAGIEATTKTIEEEVDNHEKRITNLERHTSDDYFYTNNKTAQIVPAGVCPYAQIDKIGGMSYKSNNMFKPISADEGVTIAEDGTISFEVLSATWGDEDTGTHPVEHDIYFDTSILKPNANYQFEIICPWNDYGYTSFESELYIDEGHVHIKADGGGYFYEPPYAPFESYEISLVGVLYEQGTTKDTTPHFDGLRNTETTELISKSPNLFKIKKAPDGMTLNADGSVTFTLPAPDAEYEEEYSETYFTFNSYDSDDYECLLEPDKTYTFSISADCGDNVYFDEMSFDYLANINVADAGMSKQCQTWGEGEESFHTVPLVKSRGTYCSGKFSNYTNSEQQVTMRIMVYEGEPRNAEYVPYRDEPIDTFHISEELLTFLADKGYGAGANNDYNYIDFERKKFVQNVYEVDLGELDWLVHATSRFVATLPKANKATNSYDKKADAICSLYDIQTQNKVYANTMGIATSSNGVNAYVYDARYTDVNAFKQAMSGAKFCYALAKPIEIDISNYIDDDNYIEVESGAVIKSINQYDKEISTEITYLLKERNV